MLLGVVVVEVVFSYNALGQYLVDHVSKRDLPVVQAVGMIFAAVYIGESFLWQLGANYDVSRDNVGIIFGLEPRFLVRPQMFRPGYAALPPPSSDCLE